MYSKYAPEEMIPYKITDFTTTFVSSNKEINMDISCHLQLYCLPHSTSPSVSSCLVTVSATGSLTCDVVIVCISQYLRLRFQEVGIAKLIDD